MRFGQTERTKFGTKKGAYSRLTEREYDDSQLTCTDYEYDLLTGHFDEIHRGNVRSNPKAAKKTFRLHGTGEEVQLNLVYPKAEKDELRLYLSTRAGYKPLPGRYWFVYVLDSEIYIGSMETGEWIAPDGAAAPETDDILYQGAINDDPSAIRTVTTTSTVFARDLKKAKARLALSGYTCEFDPSHQLFIARSTGRPYVEAHHLVPIGCQGSFELSLDELDNIFAICPTCHSLIHHALPDDVRAVIDGLVSVRPDVLRRLDITSHDLYQIYECD